MGRIRQLLGLGGLCVALAGCASHGGPNTLASRTDADAVVAELTLDTPIGQICDDPRGRAVLDRNLPNLRKNRNYLLFEGMSLRQLASMSGGKITDANLESVRLDLAALTTK